MRAVTGGGAKELLPIAGKPVLFHAIGEVVSAGAKPIVVVSRLEKTDLNDAVLARRDANLSLRFQNRALGLAHAVASAGVTDQPALLAMGDSAYLPDSPVARLKGAVESGAWGAIAVRQVPIPQVSLYGIVAFDSETRHISRTVEKPDPSESPSDWAVSGRYALSERAMQEVATFVANWNESTEVPLTPFFQSALSRGEKLIAVPVESGENLYDCGDEDSYRRALEELGK